MTGRRKTGGRDSGRGEGSKGEGVEKRGVERPGGRDRERERGGIKATSRHQIGSEETTLDYYKSAFEVYRDLSMILCWRVVEGGTRIETLHGLSILVFFLAVIVVVVLV